MSNNHNFKQLILEEYTSMLLEQKTAATGSKPVFPYAKPNISPKISQAIDNTAIVQTKADPKTRIQYTTGVTNATPPNPDDLTGPGKYRGYSEIIDSMLTNLSDDFKETKFYRAIKQIQRDIESDINSISDPDSEQRRKLRHDIERFEDWTTGLVNCWSTWDCFINGPKYGIRAKLYSPEGIGVSAFTSIFPPTRVATSAVFGILLADDIYRFDQGERSANLIVDFALDMIGTMAGGVGAGIAKAVSKDVVIVFKNVIFPVVQAGFKGATGAELRIALQWAKQSGGKSIGKFLEFIKPISDSIASFGATIIKMIDNVGSALQDWLRGLYEIPVIGDIAYEITRTVLSKLYDAKAMLLEFVKSFTVAIKGLRNLINLPGTTVDAILTKLGFKIPATTGAAIKIATNAYAISKAITYYETWNQSKLDAEAIEDHNSKIAAASKDGIIAAGKFTSKDVQAVFSGADDYINFYKVNDISESNPADTKTNVDQIDFELTPNSVGAPCTIYKFSSDKRYVMIILFSEDANLTYVWTDSADIKKQPWLPQ